MWVTTPTLLPLLPITPPPPLNFPNTFTRRRNIISASSAAASSKEVGGLGQAVFGALKPSPKKDPGSNQKPKPGEGRKEPAEENKGNKELNGSDILRALQKAGARKAQVSSGKKQPRKNGSTAQLKNRVVVNYDKVRPTVVKSDWATRLDDLEKRLQEFTGI